MNAGEKFSTGARALQHQHAHDRLPCIRFEQITHLKAERVCSDCDSSRKKEVPSDHAFATKPANMSFDRCAFALGSFFFVGTLLPTTLRSSFHRQIFLVPK